MMRSVSELLQGYAIPAFWVLVGVAVLLYFFSWYKDVNHDRKDFSAFMEEVRADIKKIFERLPPKAVNNESPLKLTEYGETLSSFLGAEKWATEIVETLLPRVSGKDAYQIQEFCDTYVLDEFQPTDLQSQKILECMFQHGATRTHVNEVLSLVLRDKILTKLGMMHLAS